MTSLQDVVDRYAFTPVAEGYQFITPEFVDQVKQKAIGTVISNALNPGEQFVKLVHDVYRKVANDAGVSIVAVGGIAGWHHEKLDGSGYPDGITAAQIPHQVRILTISDIYDALTAADRLDVGSGHGPVHHFHRYWGAHG